MPINTKVKKTGQFFEATNEEHSSSNVHVLEKGKSYSGSLYEGYFEDAKAIGDLIEFTCTKARTPATFSADELAQIPLPVKLRFSHLKRKKTNALGDDLAIEVKCVADGVESILLLDDPPKVGQPIEIGGVQRKVTRVVKNRFMDQSPTFSIEVE
jgi:hypothetical protein